MALPSMIPMPEVAARRAVKRNFGSPNSWSRELREFGLEFVDPKWPFRVISGIPEIF